VCFLVLEHNDLNKIKLCIIFALLLKFDIVTCVFLFSSLIDMEQHYSELADSDGRAKYFRLPGLLWLIAVPFGLALLTVSYLYTEYILALLLQLNFDSGCTIIVESYINSQQALRT
jgi:hypothetical protein